MLPVVLLAALILSSGPDRAAARKAALQDHPTGAVSPLSEAEARAQAEALLGAIDTAVSQAQWRALGPGALPLLAELVDDPDELPTRRARAVDGLATLGGAATRGRLTRAALSDDEPLVVRLAALRGLGAVVPSPELAAALAPLLRSARDSRIRAAAGEVLVLRVGDQGACPAVAAQLEREGPDGRAQFHRAARACGLAGAPDGAAPRPR
jgi:hypothetical protein